MNNFYEFLNSRDIKRHLEKTGYEFSPEEALFVVHESHKRTLEEKHAAYKEITALYPDHILEKRPDWDDKVGSLPVRDFVDALIAEEDRLVEACKRNGNDAVYTCQLYERAYDGRDRWFPFGHSTERIFSSFDACLDAAMGETPIRARIAKRCVDRDESIELELLPDGRILSVSARGNDTPFSEAFDGMWVSIPTPFSLGDILMNVTAEDPYKTIAVLAALPTWGGDEYRQNGFVNVRTVGAGSWAHVVNYDERDKSVERRKKCGCKADMALIGYTFFDGRVHGPDDAFTAPYTNYEVCHLLPKTYEILLGLSQFLKGRIGLGQFLSEYADALGRQLGGNVPADEAFEI